MSAFLNNFESKIFLHFFKLVFTSLVFLKSQPILKKSFFVRYFFCNKDRNKIFAERQNEGESYKSKTDKRQTERETKKTDTRKYRES